MKHTTIAAISTAQGTGGIGVVRISGENAIQIAGSVFRGVNNKKVSDLKGYTAAFGHIVEQGTVIDEAVVTVFRAPHSYTGEDVVELSCHGGIYITKQVLRAVLQAGASMAEAGEFTKRAFLNGKIDLTEAESVMDIINAKSESAARAALYVKDGTIRKKIDTIKDQLVYKAAHLSAWADYPEEDVPEITETNLEQTLRECISKLEQLLNTYDMGQAVKEGIDTVIAGKPNVGKSTIMNLLAGCERSIVTDIPGTTRDIIEETVILDDIMLRLSDTAGIRFTADEVEKIGVDKAKARLANCGLVLCVFDSSNELTKDDFELIEAVKNLPAIAVINKTDLKPKMDTQFVEEQIGEVVYISAKEETGIDKLAKAVMKVTDTEQFDPSQGILANERQRTAVYNGVKSLKEAYDALQMGITFDAVTVSMEEAISELLELTGEKASEAVVDGIFHNFCVGK